VKVVGKLNSRHVLINLRGNRLTARLSGSLPSELFVARVQKLKPRLELRVLRDLGSKDQKSYTQVLTKAVRGKNSFIQHLFDTDNLFKALSVLVKGDRREIKNSLQQSVEGRRKILSMKSKQGLNEYVVLESLHNFMSSDSFYFLLPLVIGRRHLGAELEMTGSRENIGGGLFLNIHLDDTERIAFLVIIDFEVINCTLSTNNREIEGKLRQNIGLLENGLKSLKYDRGVNLRFVPYSEETFGGFGSLKKIDVKM
jgi:hypothetical protein